MLKVSSKTVTGFTTALAMCLTAGLTAVVTTGSAFAQGKYPDRPVRVYVGYAAGGLPDTVARGSWGRNWATCGASRWWSKIDPAPMASSPLT